MKNLVQNINDNIVIEAETGHKKLNMFQILRELNIHSSSLHIRGAGV